MADNTIAMADSTVHFGLWDWGACAALLAASIAIGVYQVLI